MKKLAFLMVLLIGIPAWAGTIQITPSPVPLRGAFTVQLMGLQAESGDVVVVNVNTGELVRVPLRSEGGKLVSEEIYALRDCDPVPEGAKYVLHVAVGHVIAAATELEDGLSTTALVAVPSGQPSLSLYTWDATQGGWCSRKAGTTLSPGRLRIQVDDLTKDVSCEEESVPVSLALAGESTQLDLREEALAGGCFVAEVELVLEPDGMDLAVKLMHRESELLRADFSEDASLTVTYGTLVLKYPLASLAAGLTLYPGHHEDVGCPVQVSVTGATPDEVIWYVDGMEQPERGGQIGLVRTQPTYPQEIPVVALVRQGALWTKAQTAVVFVPPTQISFLDAETGESVSGASVCGRKLRVRLACAYDDPTPRVWIGILGQNCSARELPVSPQGDGIYLSEEFSPDEFSACAGDVLWAQYKDPSCPEDVAYVLLVLR